MTNTTLNLKRARFHVKLRGYSREEEEEEEEEEEKGV
jgi:hypothetical protein